MASQPETRIQRAIQKFVEGLGSDWYVLKIHGGPYQRVGVPDLLIVHKGKALWLEVKTKTGVVSKKQEYEMERLRDAGCVTGVVRSVEEARSFVESLQLQDL